MEWLVILSQIFEVCIIPLLGVLTTILIQFLKTKRDELVEKSKNDTLDKYITMLNDTVTECVIATNQTYVESLKAQGSFDIEAQKTALQVCYDKVMTILNAEAREYLTEAYGDLTTTIMEKIESEVNKNKTK